MKIAGGYKNQHAEAPRRFLESEILNNIWMIQILQSFVLELQCLHHHHLTTVVHVVSCSLDLDLFDGKHFASGGVQCNINFAVRSRVDEPSSNPFEDRYGTIVSRYEQEIFIGTHV